MMRAPSPPASRFVPWDPMRLALFKTKNGAPSHQQSRQEKKCWNHHLPQIRNEARISHILCLYMSPKTMRMSTIQYREDHPKFIPNPRSAYLMATNLLQRLPFSFISLHNHLPRRASLKRDKFLTPKRPSNTNCFTMLVPPHEMILEITPKRIPREVSLDCF